MLQGSNGGTPLNHIVANSSISQNISHISGVSPFHSADHSFSYDKEQGSYKIESSLSYHTCDGCSGISCVCNSLENNPSPLSRTRQVNVLGVL